MSIHIEIWKLFEDEDLATYAFGSWRPLLKNRTKGKVVIFKKNGDVYLIECIDKRIPRERYYDFYLPRVTLALLHHRRNGMYPDKTEIPTLSSE